MGPRYQAQTEEVSSMDEITFQDLSLRVAPSNGSQTRRVLAIWRGQFCHADTLNVWRASDRERFYATLGAKIGNNPKTLFANIDEELIKIAENVDMEAAKAARATAPELQGRPIQLDPPEPWPNPVNLAETLDQHVALLKRHIFASEESFVAAVLWACATHAIDFLDAIGYLRITSPDKQCGKSTFARLIKESTRKPLYVANVTPASLFRLIELVTPTLIMDECDNILKSNPELLSMLNAGITRKEAVVYRCVGDNDEIRQFSVFGPKLICGIGDIAGPLASRCITILMHRKPKQIKLPRINQGLAEAEEIAKKYSRWMQDNAKDINFDAEPFVPDTLDDRQADCWRALFVIADVAGEKWPQLARQAATALSCISDVEDNVNVRLLLDIARIFEHRTEVSASEIASVLNDTPDLEWSHFGGRGLSAVAVGRRLKNLGVTAKRTKAVNVYSMDAIKALAANYARDELADNCAIRGVVLEGGRCENQSSTPQVLDNQEVTTQVEDGGRSQKPIFHQAQPHNSLKNEDLYSGWKMMEDFYQEEEDEDGTEYF
jgi:hypothetical protein